VVSTHVKRLWLRRLYAQVGAGLTYSTLLAALQGEAFKSLDSVKGGAIASTSGNGYSVAYSSRENGPGVEDFAALGGEMLDLYDTARAALVAAAVPSPTDAQIQTEMLDRLQPIYSVQGDYTDLRRESVEALS
jgi:hypothetical protein